MRFYVDVEDSSGNKLGRGPITSATDWRVRAVMDGAGDWSFTAPLADVKVAQATPRRYAHIYALLAGGYTWVGGGPIDAIRTEISDDGIVMATVSGSDLLRELAWRSVGNLTIDDGASGPTTHAVAVATVAAFAPAGWTITADSSPGHDAIYGQFGGESVLAALATIAERSRSHLVLTGKRVLTFIADVSASGVHAVAAADDLGTGVCAISSLGIESSSYDLYSRIIPIGAGQSLTALTLRATTRTADAGYTLDTTANYLRNDAVETAYGRCELVVAFKDIAPISSTTADVRSAANMLYDAALAWLANHAAPIVAYQVSVVECPILLRPLETIRISFDDPAQNLTIDEDLIVLGVDWQGDESGVRTAGLTVATADQWPERDVDALVASITNGNIYQAYPQLTANDLVIPYAEPVDETEQAEFWWRLDDYITQLVRVVFDFELKPLQSTVKTVGLEQSTGGTITTSFSGDSGASGATSTGEPSNNSSGAAIGNTGAASGDTGAATGNTGFPSDNNSGMPSNNTSGTPSNNTSGSASGTAYSSGTHQHGVDVFAITNPSGSPVYLYNTGGTYYLGAPGLGGAVEVKTKYDFGHTHSLSNHQHDLSNHQHSLNNHQHNLANHQHSLNGHTHDLNSHTHSLNSHSHTIAHTHTINHTHTFTPSVTTVYGIYREAAGSTFALTDLEYSMDGATWYAFTVGVNGFASLGSSRYRVDLTALLQDTTTLRPLASNNLLRVRRKSTGATGKTATIKAQLGIRTIIQALALT